MQEVNTKTITEIAQKTPTSEAFFTYAACRERNVREGVSRIGAIRAQMEKEGFHPVPQDMLSMFRELERAGVGELKKDTFKWNVPIKKVGELSEVRPLKPAPLNVSQVLPRVKKAMVIVFENGNEASISFSPELTQANIEFIKQRLLQECK